MRRCIPRAVALLALVLAALIGGGTALAAPGGGGAPAAAYAAANVCRPNPSPPPGPNLMQVTAPVPGQAVVSPIVDESHFTDYWRFTPASCAALVGEFFGYESTRVRAYGNVLTSIAFLMGMACEELAVSGLEKYDQRFAMLVGVCAIKDAFAEE